MAAGFALLAVFAAVERRSGEHALIAPSLLRNRAFTSGLVVGIVFFSGFAGLLLVVSLFLQLGLHFTPVHAGLTFIPMSLGVAITAGASYALMPRFGRKVLQGGLLIVAAALVWLAITVTHDGLGVSSWELVPALLAFGLGMGFVFGPLFNVILAGVEDHEVGSASGHAERGPAAGQLDRRRGPGDDLLLAARPRPPVAVGHDAHGADLGRPVRRLLRAVLPAPQGRADGGVLTRPAAGTAPRCRLGGAGRRCAGVA